MSGYVNERAAARWAAVLLGRGSAVDMGSRYPRHLWMGEVLSGDHARAEAIELGSRAWQWVGRPWPVYRERL